MDTLEAEEETRTPAPYVGGSATTPGIDVAKGRNVLKKVTQLAE